MLKILIIFTVMTLQTPIKVGDKVPDFSLPNENGDTVSIKSMIGANPLVIYFYPKDDTPGCTMEACSFRDQYEVFQDLGVRVIGISSDSPQSHANFKRKYNLPFTLLSDSNKKVQQLFGVKKNFLGLIDGRVTYVLDKHGTIRHIFSSQLRPKRHIEEALEVIRSLD